MKMGTTAWPWRYDAAAAQAFSPENQRRTAILRYAWRHPMTARRAIQFSQLLSAIWRPGAFSGSAWTPAILGVFSIAYCLLAALNSVLTFDDLWFVEHFAVLLDREGPWQTLLTLWLSLDLGGMEYRLYGLSKIIHFGLWLLFGTHAWAYAVVIAASQLATGCGIYIVLRRMTFDKTQCAVAAAIWVLSPFAVTSCFIISHTKFFHIN
jgi:hypothetical protein